MLPYPNPAGIVDRIRYRACDRANGRFSQALVTEEPARLQAINEDIRLLRHIHDGWNPLGQVTDAVMTCARKFTIPRNGIRRHLSALDQRFFVFYMSGTCGGIWIDVRSPQSKHQHTESIMRNCIALVSIVGALLVCMSAPAPAQDLGPKVKTIRDGIYVYSAKDEDSNVTIIRTQEGVVLVDSGQNPNESRTAMSLVKKLTPEPVRFIVHTEPHGDHTTGDFVFSPPAILIAAAGAGESIKQNNPAPDPAYRTVLPHIEYQNKMTLNMGDRTLELFYLKNVHSEADTGIWLPKERVLFAAATVGVKRFPNIRPFLTIPDILAAIKTMRALNPEVVIPGHGAPGTTKIFDEMERYYALLLERVRKMAAEGKTLEQVKAELRMPEFDDWVGKDRFPTNVEAAWRAVKR